MERRETGSRGAREISMIVRVFASRQALLRFPQALRHRASLKTLRFPAARATPATPEQPAALLNSMIGPDDTVTIEALDAEEISKTWRVNSSGDLDLPMVGKVHAAGLNTEQLEKALAEALKRYIRNPQVTVYVSDFEASRSRLQEPSTGRERIKLKEARRFSLRLCWQAGRMLPVRHSS